MISIKIMYNQFVLDIINQERLASYSRNLYSIVVLSCCPCIYWKIWEVVS